MATGLELGRPVNILLVEDSPTDAILTIEALNSGSVSNVIHHVENGEEALHFLRDGEPTDTFGGARQPDLILLDLNMPRMNGHEFLRAMRADPELRLIPVVVLTTSNDDKDVARAYGLRANSYIVKPVDFHKFVDAIQLFDGFWLSVVAFPTRNAAS